MEAHAPGSVAWVQSGKFTSVVVTTKSTRLHLSETLVSRIRKKKINLNRKARKSSFKNYWFVKGSKKIKQKTTQKSAFLDLAWGARDWISPERKILENVCCRWRVLISAHNWLYETHALCMKAMWLLLLTTFSSSLSFLVWSCLHTLVLR